MSGGIDRIGSNGSVSRSTPSTGHDAIEKADDLAQKKEARNPGVDQVAKLYEKQFLGEMFKAMRSTIKHTDEPSMAENIYNDQLDQQYVDAWGEHGGIGLSNIIYDQIMQKYFDEGGSDLKKQGPVQITDRDLSRVSRIANTSGQSTQIPLKVEVKPSADGKPVEIQAPWDAKVLSKNQIGEKTVLTLSHGSGLKSTLVFNGVVASNAAVGSNVTRGQTIGVLSPDQKSFLWNLNESKIE